MPSFLFRSKVPPLQKDPPLAKNIVQHVAGDLKGSKKSRLLVFEVQDQVLVYTRSRADYDRGLILETSFMRIYRKKAFFIWRKNLPLNSLLKMVHYSTEVRIPSQHLGHVTLKTNVQRFSRDNALYQNESTPRAEKWAW